VHSRHLRPCSAFIARGILKGARWHSKPDGAVTCGRERRGKGGPGSGKGGRSIRERQVGKLESRAAASWFGQGDCCAVASV